MKARIQRQTPSALPRTPCSPWVARKVLAMFDGRKGHGGGPCCSRVLRAEQLRDLLQEAFQAGIKSQENA